MLHAIELGKEGASKGFGGPFGSVIVKDGKIVAFSIQAVDVDVDERDKLGVKYGAPNVKILFKYFPPIFCVIYK